MTIEQASTFLVGSILTTIGFIVIITAVIFVNYILHKYWKPVRIFTADSWAPFSGHPVRYVTEEELARITQHNNEEKAKK
jgi:hypothetical protein